MMTKLREALSTVDSENAHTGAAVRQGDPGTQILQFAKSMRADVIVMGAAGAERPTRPMGSVTATVVARSDCPVLIVPTGRRVDRLKAGVFKQILCAVGLAPSSVSVIRQALSLAWETHGHVRCVCVMTEPSPSSSEIQTQILAAIPPEAKEWCDVEVVVKPGVPATEIVRAAETSNVDVLLIGPPRQWTSTTQAVLAKSLCPVWSHMTLGPSRTLLAIGQVRALAAANPRRAEHVLRRHASSVNRSWVFTFRTSRGPRAKGMRLGC